MKRFLKFGLIGLFMVSMFSCDLHDDDDYSLGKFWVGFGLVEVDESDSSNITIKMDDGSVLYPVSGYSSWQYLNDFDRVLVNYTILGDKFVDEENEEYYIKVNSVKDILYKGIFNITAATEDSIGNDPIHVHDVWKANNLLTFELDYYGNYMTHYVNLVKAPGELTAEDEPIELELRHNNRDDEPRYNMSALVTFDLSSIQILGQDSVQFKVTGKDFEGDSFNYTGVYHY
ncbi:NigD-like protein [Sunxiuqinia sp. A32]|uniref:NigD-like protein n=1 Tax=Sunxiuqinia sp. A32 TaxID=3461496 RepID=UPI0040453E72